jgi:hypothetical protein
MHDGLDARERAANGNRISHVAADELDVGGEVLRPPQVAVHLRDQRVEYANAIAAREQGVGEVRADEARATRDENVLRQSRAGPSRRRYGARRPCRSAPT